MLAELQRITVYEGRMTRELQRLKAELAEMQKERRNRATAERLAALEPELQARAEALADALLGVRPAAPAEAPPMLAASDPALRDALAALDDWTRRERGRLDAAARAARQTPAAPTA